MFNQLKAQLPNCPDEVIQTWLAPLAAVYGWPPAIFGPWSHILLQRPLQFYQTLAWQKVAVVLNAFNLTPKANAAVSGLIDHNVHGVVNAYADIANTGNRFSSLCDYIRAHGTLPVPPVVLREGFAYAILDGNHRIAAYNHVNGANANITGLVCWVASVPAA